MADSTTAACFQQLEAGLKQSLAESVAKLQSAAGGVAEGVPSGGGGGAAKKRILKDGVAVNDSIYPKVGVPSDPEGITKEWLTDCLVSRKIIAANNCVASMESTQIGEGRGYANVSPRPAAPHVLRARPTPRA